MTRIKKLLSRWLPQLGWILFYLSVFLGTAVISWHFGFGVIEIVSRKWILFDAVVFSTAWLVWIILMIWCKKGTGSPEKKLGTALKDSLKEHYPIVIVLIIAFCQRIWMIGTMQRWDSAEYYYKLGSACKNFTFSLGSYLNVYKLCLHPTYGMVLFTAPGEFLNFRSVVGVQICTLILTLGAVYALYHLFAGFFSNMNRKRAALATLFCSSLPLFWGSFAYYNPDYFICLFLIFFMYSDQKKNYISMAFWGLMVAFCKETGIMVVFGYAFARVLSIFFTTKGFGKKILAEVAHGGNWAALFAGVGYLLYAKINGGMTSWNTSDMNTVTTFSWNNDGMNCFGINLSVVYERWRQLFVLNYAWILWAAIVLIALYLLIRGKKRECRIPFISLCGLIGAGTIYFVFNCLYITYPIYRYHVFWVLGSGILFCVFFHEILQEVPVNAQKMVWTVPMTILTLLLGSQAMYHTDKVSELFMEAVPAGREHTIMFPSNGSRYFGDYLVTNYEYSYLDRCMNTMLREAEYDNDTVIYIPVQHFMGSFIDGRIDVWPIRWDEERRERTFRSTENTIPIQAVRIGEITENTIENYMYGWEYGENHLRDRALIFFFPFFEDDEAYNLSRIQEYYSVGTRHVIQDPVGEMVYYELEALDIYR